MPYIFALYFSPIILPYIFALFFAFAAQNPFPFVEYPVSFGGLLKVQLATIFVE